MKEIITPVKYEAIDGASFLRKEQCEDYEATLKVLNDYCLKYGIPCDRLAICWWGEDFKKYRG